MNGGGCERLRKFCSLQVIVLLIALMPSQNAIAPPKPDRLSSHPKTRTAVLRQQGRSLGGSQSLRLLRKRNRPSPQQQRSHHPNNSALDWAIALDLNL